MIGRCKVCSQNAKILQANAIQPIKVHTYRAAIYACYGILYMRVSCDGHYRIHMMRPTKGRWSLSLTFAYSVPVMWSVYASGLEYGFCAPACGFCTSPDSLTCRWQPPPHTPNDCRVYGTQQTTYPTRRCDLSISSSCVCVSNIAQSRRAQRLTERTRCTELLVRTCPCWMVSVAWVGGWGCAVW